MRLLKLALIYIFCIPRIFLQLRALPKSLLVFSQKNVITIKKSLIKAKLHKKLFLFF